MQMNHNSLQILVQFWTNLLLLSHTQKISKLTIAALYSLEGIAATTEYDPWPKYEMGTLFGNYQATRYDHSVILIAFV